MKKLLSLILTLAMVLSLVTVPALAKGSTKVAVDGVQVLEYTNTLPTTGVAVDTAAHGATLIPVPANASKDYTWEIVTDGGSSKLTLARQTSDHKKATVTGKAVTESDVTVKCTCEATWMHSPKEGDPSYPCKATGEQTFTVQVVSGAYSLVVENSDNRTVTVPMGGEVNLVAPVLKENNGDSSTPVDSGSYTVAYKVTSGTGVASVGETSGKVTGVKGGTATVTATATYAEIGLTKTVTYTITVQAITAKTSIVNCGTYSRTAAQFKGDMASAINSAFKLTGEAALKADDVTAVKLTAPAGAAFGTLYAGSAATAAQPENAVGTNKDVTSSGIFFASKKGALGDTEYAVTVSAKGTEYQGTFVITLTPNKNNVNVDISAPFAHEEYELVSESGYKAVYICSGSNDYAGDRYGSAKSKIMRAPADETIYVIVYDKNGLASTGKLVVDAPDYDIAVVGEDDKSPFDEDDFQDFIENVNEEQEEYYDVAISSVKFTDYAESNKWALYDGSKKLTNGNDIDADDLDDITINVEKPGTYYITFKAYFNYKNSKNDTKFSTTEDYYEGEICVYANGDGDIVYEVDAGKSVQFEEDDFAAFYKKEKGGTLYSVTFGEPSKGALYAYYTSSKKNAEATDNTFYTYDKAGKNDYEIDDVLYYAEAKPTTEYSVYIPFTAKGSKTALEGTVEIVVNGNLPFTDVPENSTFYEYIKYCYRNGIMNGKTTKLFKPGEDVTRVQLVATLYRMAGSPTTYNSRTMSFTDCKSLNAEFQSAIKWGVANKLINGYGNLFKPTASITRQAMVTILYRYANTFSDSAVGGAASLIGYKDYKSVASGEMETAMKWAVGNGIVSGTADGYLKPLGSTTRGACAKILANYDKSF